MNGIDIIKYYLYKNQNFVRRSLPSVEVVNRAVGKPDMVTASLAFVSELLKQWRVNQRKNLFSQFFFNSLSDKKSVQFIYYENEWFEDFRIS